MIISVAIIVPRAFVIWLFPLYSYAVPCVSIIFSLLPSPPQKQCIMTDSIMSKAATMEIPINSNGDTGTLPEDDSLEQVGHS